RRPAGGKPSRPRTACRSAPSCGEPRRRAKRRLPPFDRLSNGAGLQLRSREERAVYFMDNRALGRYEIAMDTINTEVAIIGAGVIGLAIAATLPRSQPIVLLEGFGAFGQETSSRNSEVIHSGIYYPSKSRKTIWCIEGRERLYRYCEDHRLP